MLNKTDPIYYIYILLKISKIFVRKRFLKSVLSIFTVAFVDFVDNIINNWKSVTLVIIIINSDFNKSLNSF